MKIDIQYLTNVNGNKTAVQTPINEWNRYQRKFKEIESHLKLKKGLKEAIEELDDIRKGKKRATKLREFLNEL